MPKTLKSPASQLNCECSAQSREHSHSSQWMHECSEQSTNSQSSQISVSGPRPRSHCLVHQLTPPSLFGFLWWLTVLNVGHKVASLASPCDSASTLWDSTKLCSTTVHYSFGQGHHWDNLHKAMNRAEASWDWVQVHLDIIQAWASYSIPSNLGKFSSEEADRGIWECSWVQ